MLLRSVWARALRAPARPRTRARSTAAAAAAAAEAPEASAAEEWARARPYDEIPGIEPLPVVGNGWRFLPYIGEFGGVELVAMLNQLRARYGDLVRVPRFIGGYDTVFVFAPQLAEAVFRQEGRWPIREGIDSLHYYRSVLRKDKYQGTMGIVVTQGKEWGDFRTKVNQPMMQPAYARRYLTPINEVADDFIDRMRALRDEKGELPGNFINELYKWALESIATVALDTRLGCLAPDLTPDSEAQRMIEAVHTCIDGFYELDIKPSPWRYISTPTWRRYVKAMDYFYDVANKYVQRAAEAAGAEAGAGAESARQPSIMQRLRAEDPKVAIVMAADMMFAGIDTTSHAFASLLFFLSKNPEQQQTLREELIRELPSGPRPALTDETLSKMPYLRACLRESLRLFPISAVNVRTAPNDIVVGGYQIPKGKRIIMGHMMMSRDEQRFPNPERFEPRRWLRGDELAHSAHPFTSLPWGFGARTCVGRRFAELEIYTLVTKVLRNFRVEYHHGEELQYKAKIINTVASPLKFRLIDL